MKKLIVLVCFLTILFISTTASASNLQGCCSHHDGVVSVDGKLECGDGTSLSNVCESKIEIATPLFAGLDSEELFIAKCTIATVMGRSPSIMEAKKVGSVIYVSYKRSSDGTIWRFKFKLEGGLVTWGNADGRWRTEDYISYESNDSTVTVTEMHSDGSRTIKRFKK